VIITREGQALEVRCLHEVLRVEPWGADSVRVRAGRQSLPSREVGALDTTPPAGGTSSATIDGQTARLVVGNLTVEVLPSPSLDDGGAPQPFLRFLSTQDGRELLAEKREHFMWPGARAYYGNRSGADEVHQQFQAYDGEKIFGMGQRTHGRLDHKGLALDLVQRNAEVSIPFFVSDRGYGFLWNNPAIGRVEFADNVTRWTAAQSEGIDYFVTAGEPAQVLGRYADATGHAPELPRWASGFWQSKLRYRSQDELMEVVREYRRRGLPLSVIVSDFFHWTAMGDYRFDPAEYPDPAAMMRELEELDVKLMVSIWPTISPLSENFPRMAEEGLLVGSDGGTAFHAMFADKGASTPFPVSFYDPTNVRTREFVWDVVKRNYHDLGVRAWWLDACEPEIQPQDHHNLQYAAGPGAQVASVYPRDNARLFAEGMAREAQASGDPVDGETVLLCRSAWAGQQRYPAAVWSGDIPATWDSLRRQVRAGLSIAMAGIAWWTTDIGGFHGGDVRDPEYRELMVRWFQFAAFCPLFRLHGYREPRPDTSWAASGGPNEVWSYGDEAYEHITSVLHLRERLRPYVHEQLSRTSTDGVPAMRPVFVDFPHDPLAWQVDDAFLFGSDVLVAPVLDLGSRERVVYLPAGARWTDAWTGEVHSGGTSLRVEAPLSRIPVFLRDGADVPVAR
jgi:alpha-D-xyloside xylohydrolase